MSITEHEKIEVRESTELDPRVRRGAAFLDEWEDGWAQKIDLETLDLEDECFCVLGQVRGDYDKALQFYGHDRAWGEHHGFDTGTDGCDEDDFREWRALEADWVTLIRERQGEHA